MNLNNRPPPLFPVPIRALCPVCGQTSYSSTGVHPQCSMQKADRERMQALGKVGADARKVTEAAELSPWQRGCPRCKAVVHVRKKVCTCGYKFPVRPATSRS